MLTLEQREMLEHMLALEYLHNSIMNIKENKWLSTDGLPNRVVLNVLALIGTF